MLWLLLNKHVHVALGHSAGRKLQRTRTCMEKTVWSPESFTVTWLIWWCAIAFPDHARCFHCLSGCQDKISSMQHGTAAVPWLLHEESGFEFVGMNICVHCCIHRWFMFSTIEAYNGPMQWFSAFWLEWKKGYMLACVDVNAYLHVWSLSCLSLQKFRFVYTCSCLQVKVYVLIAWWSWRMDNEKGMCVLYVWYWSSNYNLNIPEPSFGYT